MNTSAATSIRHEIVVRAPIARAFSVFTDEMGSFKPPEHNMLGVEIAETVFEPRVGGRVYDRGVDGSECQWARVLAYEPPDRVVISWDISPRHPAHRSDTPTFNLITREFIGPASCQHTRERKMGRTPHDRARARP